MGGCTIVGNCISSNSLILIAVLKAPIGVEGAGVDAQLEVSLNGLAIFVEFRLAFLCPMPALATVGTIPRGDSPLTAAAKREAL